MGYAQDLARLRQQHILGANPMPMPDDMGMGDPNTLPMSDSMPMPDSLPPVQNDIGGLRNDVNAVASRFGGNQLPPPVDPDLQKYQDIVNALYTNDTTDRDRLRALLDQYPQEGKLGLGRTIVASGMALGKGGYDAADKFLHEPHTRELADWTARATPFQAAATNENQRNVNERMLATNAATNIFTAEKNQKLADIAAEKNRITDEKNKRDSEAAMIRARAQAYTASLGKGWDWDLTGPTAKKFNKTTGDIIDTGLDTGKMDEQTKIELQNEGKVAAARESGTWGVQRVQAAGGQTFQMDGKTYSINPRTNQAEEVQLPEGTLIKPGTPGAGGGVTNSTRTMMEGAKMLLPHVTELRQQATELDKRGLFGPIMSRVRGLMAKVGTTGSPEEVQQNLEEFTNNLMNDPLINSSNDAMVGRFVANLGLMASGAGRVHGGARGGGSIQMVNYMKGLLTSDSTLDMFNGRLDAVDSYMKTYALGPGGSADIKSKTPLDTAIDKALGTGETPPATTPKTTKKASTTSGTPPPRPAGIPAGAIAQYSASAKKWRYSTDDGKTWTEYGGK